MEQTLPIVTKKFRNKIRALYLVLRKEISKGKLLFDLNMALNRTKFANKLSSIRNIMFHHSAMLAKHQLKKRKGHVMMPPSNNALMASPFDIFNRADATPALPGFGPSLMLKQVRISDSPYQLREVDQDEVDQDYNIHVDEAAEEFILKFYQNLRQQNGMVNN